MARRFRSLPMRRRRPSCSGFWVARPDRRLSSYPPRRKFRRVLHRFAIGRGEDCPSGHRRGMNKAPFGGDLRIRTPADLATVVPYLVGYQPERSLVIIGERPADKRRATFLPRFDLPMVGHVGRFVRFVVAVSLRAEITSASLVLYLPDGELPEQGRAFVTDLIGAFDDEGVRVREALRVDGGRWWSYYCENPVCCPPEGTPIDTGQASVIEA